MNKLKKFGKALAFPWKHNKAFSITCVSLLSVFLAINLIITQVPLINNTFNTVFGDERRVLKKGDPSTAQYYTPSEGIENKRDALAAANAVNEKICEEGFVLLKNEESLPLAADSKISVFGMNCVDMVYGGSGSAEKSSADSVDLFKSLDNANISYNPCLKSFYENKQSKGKGRPKSPAMGDNIETKGFATGELPLSEYDGGLSSYVGEYDDAALFVVSRIGGEGYDLPRQMGGDKDRHYLELDANEEALLKELCKEDSGFDNVILILNCATSFELGFLRDDAGYAKLKGALWIGTTGGTGMNALGRVLNGEVTPSGRLVDTYAADFTKTPSWENFSTNLGAGNTYYVDGTVQNAHFVDYEEGVYVGYRYYETRGKDDKEWYDENVVYPFGYGLSYTNFEWSVTPSKAEGAFTAQDTLSFDVTVTNTGNRAGKDVVELYYTAPYTEGGIEKSHVVLGDFAKTELLRPGESGKVTVSVKASDMKSYDYNDANRNNHKGYELEAGDYTLRVAENAHTYQGNYTYTLDGAVVYGADTETQKTVANRFDDVSAHIETYLSRSDWTGTYPTMPTSDDKEVERSLIDSMSMEAYIGSGGTLDVGKPWYAARKPRQKRRQLTYGQTEYKLYDLIGKAYDDPLWDKLLNQLTYDEMRYMIGTGNFNTAAIKSIDKPKTVDPDGPAGFTNFMTLIASTATVYDTCFYASECVIGATWNVALAEEMGVAVGNESLIGNERGDGRTYSGWYAPAVNIHRNQFAGRNWEYYSEDGLLSGKMAVGVIKGAKSKGVYTYMKHFAVNDQETDRDANGLITWVNEQALREIYLKPFELAVKEGKTTAIMSSFNRIGTVWAGGSYELLTEVLRDEWCFRGMVITDYNTNDYMYADQMIRAGGDLNLIQDKQPSASGKIVTASHQAAVRRATKNILYTVVNSNAMNGMGAGIVYGYALPYWTLFMIGTDCALVVALGLWGFFSVRRSLKREKSKIVLEIEKAE